MSGERLSPSLQDQRESAFLDLALWSHPAWADSGLSTAAVTQWVVYHRVCVALDRPCVAEVIGGVRGVIPHSRLAKYGDYRYDFDYEDMYEDIQVRPLVESRDLKRSTNTADDRHTGRSLCDWLRKMKSILEVIGQIARSLDPRTEALSKICSRFVKAAMINPRLLEIMDSEIAFITDYEQLQNAPVSRTELMSIPQPELGPEPEKMDDLWLKLASSAVRRFWKYNDGHQDLTTANFLRRRRQKECSDCPVEDIDVPKEMATALLGFLLKVVDESTAAPEAVRRNSLLHGHLHRTEANKTFLQNPVTKVLQATKTNVAMPIRFYMSVPPPSPMYLRSLPRSPYPYCQTRKGMPLNQKGSVACIPNRALPPQLNYSKDPPWRQRRYPRKIHQDPNLEKGAIEIDKPFKPPTSQAKVRGGNIFQPVVCDRNPANSQLASAPHRVFSPNEPRFMGGITINDIRRAQLLNVDSLSSMRKERCEDKVGRWLETVNEHFRVGSEASTRNGTRDDGKSSKPQKKKNAGKLLLKHLNPSESSSLKFRKRNVLKRRIKLVKKYLTRIEGGGKRLERQIVSRNRRDSTPSEDRSRTCFPNIQVYKVLSRESYEFNAFPSKRMKVCALLVDEARRPGDHLARIKCLDAMTDDLFFSQGSRPANGEKVNGWTHFKMVVKTMLAYILAAKKLPDS